MNTTHDLLTENATLSARVAELEAERDEVCARGMAAGQAAMPTGKLTVIDSPELAELRARVERAEARERALLASNNDIWSALVENAKLQARAERAEVALATALEEAALLAEITTAAPAQYNAKDHWRAAIGREVAAAIRAQKAGAA